MSNESAIHAATCQPIAHIIETATNWDAPSPVSEWNAGDIVEHLLTWPVPVFSAWAGLQLSDNRSEAFTQRWNQRSTELQATLDTPTLADQPVDEGPFAGQPLRVAIDRAYTADVFTHTWDLARATGQDPDLDPDRCLELLHGLATIEDVLRSSGQYGPAHPTNSDDPVERLVAFLGRDPQWEPPASE